MAALTYNPRLWEPLAARLMLAHLEDDLEVRDLYVELVRSDSNCDSEYFALADSTAHIFASGYTVAATRELARQHLFTFLEKILEPA